MWGSYQGSEIVKQYYPSVSPMFRDYQAGYRSSSYRSPEREALIERVGTAVNLMNPALRKVLKDRFLLGGEKKAPSRVMDMALSLFIREFESLPEDLVPEAAGGFSASD